MSRKTLIVLYAIVDLIFVAIVLIGVTRGVRIQRLFPAMIIVLLSNALWLIVSIGKKPR
jgi:hypothetical protein